MRPKTVLIIEPDEKNAALFTTAFSRINCQLYLTKDFSEVLSKNPELKPSLVITDVSVVGEEGVRIINQWRQGSSPEHLTIIASIPKGNKALFAQAQSWGVDGFITKPFDPLALFLRIEKLFKGP